MKNFLASLSLTLSFVSFIFSKKIVSLTGAFVGISYFKNSFPFLFGLVLLFVSVFLFLHKVSLDAIIIPTAPSKEIAKRRAERASRERNNQMIYVISGAKEKGNLNETQRYVIYKELRRHGIKPGEIVLEKKSENTIENLMDSLELLKKKGARKIGISSNPSHLDRFETILHKAKKEGLVDKGIEIYRLRTEESFGESIYGFFAKLLNQYKLREGIKNSKKYETPNLIKDIGGYISRLFNKK